MTSDNWWDDKPRYDYRARMRLYYYYSKIALDVIKRIITVTVLSIFVFIIFCIGIYKLLVDISRNG